MFDAGTIPELVATDLGALGLAGVCDQVRRLSEAVDHVEAARLSAVRMLVSREAYGLDGARTAVAWLAHHCGLSSGRARHLVRVAVALGHMPGADQALQTGALSVAKAELAVKARDAAPERYYDDAEAWLIEQITPMSVGDATVLLAVWAATANAHHEAATGVDPADAVVARQRDGRCVYLSKLFEGTWNLQGTLDPETGATIAHTLTHIEDLLRANTTDGTKPTTPAQRRADALAEMARLALTTLGVTPTQTEPAKPTEPAATEPAPGPDLATAEPPPEPGEPDLVAPATTEPPTPGLAGPVPAITAVVDLAALAGAESLGAIVGTFGPQIPLPAAQAERWLCDAGISRVLLNGPDEVVNLGRTTYRPSPAQRRAIAHRHVHCAFPSCTMPIAACQIHHIAHWTRDHGPTDLHNLIPLCWHHHHLLHEGQWDARTEGPDHRVHFYRPDGTELVHPHERHVRPPDVQRDAAGSKEAASHERDSRARRPLPRSTRPERSRRPGRPRTARA